MSRLARGKRSVVVLLILFVAVSCIGRNDAFDTLSKKLERPMDEKGFADYLGSVFVPGLDYTEVHQRIDEIGENRICDEIVHVDGVKVEIIEIQTGSLALNEYDYLKWDFVFDMEGKLMKVALNSWR